MSAQNKNKAFYFSCKVTISRGVNNHTSVGKKSV